MGGEEYERPSIEGPDPSLGRECIRAKKRQVMTPHLSNSTGSLKPSSMPGMWMVSRLMVMPFQPLRMAPLGELRAFLRPICLTCMRVYSRCIHFGDKQQKLKAWEDDRTGCSNKDGSNAPSGCVK